MRSASALIREALHYYLAGNPAEALKVLEVIPAGDPLPDSPVWVATECERRAASPTSPATVSAAARDWVELARDRLHRELGEDVIAAVPVPLALGTALSLLEEAP